MKSVPPTQAQFDQAQETQMELQIAKAKAERLALKPTMIFHQSQDLDVTCFAKLLGTDGRFIDFAIDRDMAWNMIVELNFHLKRQEDHRANAPVPAP